MGVINVCEDCLTVKARPLSFEVAIRLETDRYTAVGRCVLGSQLPPNPIAMPTHAHQNILTKGQLARS